MSGDLLDGERIPAAPAPPGPAPSELHFDKKTTLVRLLRAKDPSVHQRLFAIRPLLQLFPIIDLFSALLCLSVVVVYDGCGFV